MSIFSKGSEILRVGSMTKDENDFFGAIWHVQEVLLSRSNTSRELHMYTKEAGLGAICPPGKLGFDRRVQLRKLLSHPILWVWIARQLSSKFLLGVFNTTEDQYHGGLTGCSSRRWRTCLRFCTLLHEFLLICLGFLANCCGIGSVVEFDFTEMQWKKVRVSGSSKELFGLCQSLIRH